MRKGFRIRHAGCQRNASESGSEEPERLTSRFIFLFKTSFAVTPKELSTKATSNQR